MITLSTKRLIEKAKKEIDLSDRGLVNENISEVVELISKKNMDLTLNLNLNNVDDNSLACLAKLKNVSYLNLDKTNIQGKEGSLIPILKNKNIKYLSLKECFLDDSALQDIINFSEQEEISIIIEDKNVKRAIHNKLKNNKKNEAKSKPVSHVLFEYPRTVKVLPVSDPSTREINRTFSLLPHQDNASNFDISSPDGEKFEAYYHLSLDEQNQGNYEMAKIFIDLALGITQNTHTQYEAICYLEKGKIFRDLDLISDARIYFNKSIKICPLPQAYNSFGLLEQREKNLEIAENFYKQAIELKPEYPEALCNLGTVMMDRCKYENAISYYNQAIELRPKAALYYNNKGIAKQGLQNFSEADQDFYQALCLTPGNLKFAVDYYTNKSILGDTDGIARLKQYYTMNSNDPYIIGNLSAIYLLHAEYQEAQAFLEKLPNNDELFYKIFSLINSAALYHIQKDYNKTLDLLDTLIINIQNYSEFIKINILSGVYLQIGIIMTSFGYWEEAEKSYTRALELTENEAEKNRLYFYRANVLFDNQKFDVAINDYRQINSNYESAIVSVFLQEAILALENNKETNFIGHSERNFFSRLSDEEKQLLRDNISIKKNDASAYESNYCSDTQTFSPITKDFVFRSSNCYELYLNPSDNFWYKKKYAYMNKGKNCTFVSGQERVAHSTCVFAFIVDKNNKILINNMGHYDLVKHQNDQSVKFAGCITFQNGIIGMWNNCSGHFKPYHYCAEDIVKITKLPFDKFQPRHIIEKRVYKIWRKCDNNCRELARILPGMTFGDKKLARDIAKNGV